MVGKRAPSAELDWADLHPETQRLLNRRGFLLKAGAAAGFSFLGLAVIGCSSDDESGAPATTSTTAAPPTTPAGPSLYDRLGGGEAVTAVVASFLATVAADDRINAFFASTDLARLQTQVVNQLGQATGGPQVYEGASMRTAHEGLGITVADFNAFVEDLVLTLDNAGVPAPEKQELLDLLAPMQSDIVTA
jgi:hemoglobin